MTCIQGNKIHSVIIILLVIGTCNTADLERGEFRSRQSGNLTVTAWRDTKVVLVMSTNTSPAAVSTVRQKAKDGSLHGVPCPESVALYNRYMGGVDKADQLRDYYPIRTKCRKFYK